MLRSSLVVVALVAMTGCLSPFIKTAADQPAPKPSKALLAGMLVHVVDSGEKKGLAGGLIDAAQNAGLDEFGKRATEQLKTVMASRGYEIETDASRSHGLDAIEIRSDSTTSALTGAWRNPDASYWTPQTIDSLFVKPKDVLAKLNPQPKEYFTFTDVSIIDEGMFMKEPHVVIRAVVYDADAKKVLDLQGLGEGESTFFISNRSPDNLEKALTRAFDSLKAVKEEPLS